MKNIARYEDILNNYDSMAGVIMEELDCRLRRNTEERAVQPSRMQRRAVFEEKKIEETGGRIPDGPFRIRQDRGHIGL